MSALSDRPRRAIANRILIFFIVTISAFGVVLAYSVYALRAAAKNTERLAQGYLPASQALAQLRATESAISTLVDGLSDERNPTATRLLLERLVLARKLRLSETSKAFARGEKILGEENSNRQLTAIREGLTKIELSLSEDEEIFERLYAALESGDRDGSNRAIVELGRVEHDGDKALRLLAAKVDEAMVSLSDSTRRSEERSMLALYLLVLAACVVALSATIYSRRMLQPLALITARARSVASGDLSPQPALTSPDELGELSIAFEKMVSSVSEEQAKSLSNERLAAIGKMAAHVTHEVRNPLSSIGLNLEMLEEEISTESSRPESMSLLRAIRREVERLERLSEEYLRVAKLPSPRIEADNLGGLIREVAEFLKGELARSSVSLHIDIVDPIPTVLFDEAQIRQALLNLLRNAKDAMKQGGSIHLKASTQGMSVVVEISDEGEGVSPEVREQIFEPFFSTKGEAGTGLGLAITKHIVASHGGRIWCEPLSKGTSFKFSLPIAPARATGVNPLIKE